MKNELDFLSATDFYKILQCPHWPYFDRFTTQDEQAHKRLFGPLEMGRLEHGVLNERELLQRFHSENHLTDAPHSRDIVQDGRETLKLMEQGVPLIYGGTLIDGEWIAKPDLLERRDGESNIGNWNYVALDIKSTHAIEKYQKLQALFYARLLERLQGRANTEGYVYTCDGELLSWTLNQLDVEFDEVLHELESIRAGHCPPLALRKSCFDTGPWGHLCQQLAEKSHDIALLANVDAKKLASLRSLGVATIEHAAKLDPDALDGKAPGLRAHGLQVLKFQAQALLSQAVIVREPVRLPIKTVELFFDIESDPPHDRDYLYGFWIRDEEGERYLPFLAATLDEEEKMWRAFLGWIETLPAEYAVYHFSPYECQRLALLERRYGATPWLDKFRSNMIDIKEITLSSVVFPLYFYGLKYIASFLGYTWSGSVKGGSQSIDVFEEYLTTGDRSLLEAVIFYNQDDVRATAVLKDWLTAFAKERKSYTVPYSWLS